MQLVKLEDGTIIVPSIDFGRHCVRCGQDAHAPDPEHLCKDVRVRWRQGVEKDFADWAREMVVHGGEG